MEFKLEEAIEILERTPNTLHTMLSGISEPWIRSKEGEGTWSAFDVVGHLIDGELDNWMVRVETILDDTSNKRFKPFDRFSHLERNQNRSLEELLEEFHKLRTENLQRLSTLIQPDSDFSQKGIHPEYGEITLHGLLSTWVVHDLTHISQITRVIAKRYQEDVGPWISYLRILKS